MTYEKTFTFTVTAAFTSEKPLEDFTEKDAREYLDRRLATRKVKRTRSAARLTAHAVGTRQRVKTVEERLDELSSRVEALEPST